MKTYSVEVKFFAKLTEKELYVRFFDIMAEDDKHAWAAVHNILSVMEFHNFVITDVKEVEK